MSVTAQHDARGGLDTDARGGSASRRAAPVAWLMRRDAACWLITLLALVLGGVFVGVDLAYNSGNIIAPIDDAYIHLQYASRLGSGHPFQYNAGDPISTGESSLLYVFVLAAGYAVGFHGPDLLAFAVVLGVLCLAATAGLTYQLGRMFASRAVGIWSGVLVAVSGPLLWGAVSGMEIGLTALLAAATVLSFAWEQPRFRLTPVLAFLLVIVRPEGMLLAIALCVAMLWLMSRFHAPSKRRAFAKNAWALLPLVAVLGQYLFYWLATGSIRANGVAAKSYFGDQPVFYAGEFLSRAVANLRGAVGLFAGFLNQDYAFPAALLFALGGGAYLLYTRPRWRPLLTAIAVGFLMIALSISTLSSALMHQLRYWQPFMPIFILLSVAGIYALTRVIPGQRARRAGFSALLVIVLAFSIAALPTWAVRLGRQSATIRQTDVSVGAWIRGNLPPDAVVAVKDVGAVAYFGEHRVVDLIGLTTNGFAKASNNGTGSLYERLQRMPPEQRPDYFAVYNKPPGPKMQPFQQVGILGHPLVTFPVQAEKAEIVPFSEIKVYPANWRLAGSGDRPPAPGQVRDYVDVGALSSEESHQYQPQMALVGTQPYTVLQRQGAVLDSGREIIGGERFTAEGLRPGEPLRIVSRIKTSGDASHLTLRINGKPIATWDPKPTAGTWQVHTWQVPADAVTSSTLQVEVGAAEPFLSPYPKYTSFGYWLIQ